MIRDVESLIVRLIRAAHPRTQAVYLYGTWGGEYQRADSDIDLAVLLPHDDAKKIDRQKWKRLAANIARIAKVNHANLINLWLTESVNFRIEIMRAERVVYCADEDARISYEATTIGMWHDWKYQCKKIAKEIRAQK